MSRLCVVLCLAMTACFDGPDVEVNSVPPPSPQEAGWPDTSAAPYVPLDRLLRPPFGSGAYLTDGLLSRLDLCPPCPPNVHCKPCPPDGFFVRSNAPGGLVEIRVEGTQALPSPTTLSEHQAILMTLDVTVSRSLERFHRAEVEDSTEYVTYVVKGMRTLERRTFTDRVWPFSD